MILFSRASSTVAIYGCFIFSHQYFDISRSSFSNKILMSKDTNFIDFLHDHYSNDSKTDMSQILARLRQHLEYQRKLVLNQIATVKKEEEELKSFADSTINQQQSVDNQTKDCLTSLDIEQINNLPLDL